MAAASSSVFNMSNFAAALGDIDLQLKSVSNAMALETTNEGKKKLKGIFDYLLERKEKVMKQQHAHAKSMATRISKKKKENAMKKLEQLRSAKRSFSQSMSRTARRAAREAKKPQPNLIPMNLASVNPNMGPSHRSSQYGPHFSRKSLNPRKHPYRSASPKGSTKKKFKSYAAHLREMQQAQQAQQAQQME